MGDRWYDAQLGRWISADTIVPEPGNPQSLNRYSYVNNNPLKFIDPTGHYSYPPGCEHSEQCMKWWDAQTAKNRGPMAGDTSIPAWRRLRLPELPGARQASTVVRAAQKGSVLTINTLLGESPSWIDVGRPLVPVAVAEVDEFLWKVPSTIGYKVIGIEGDFCFMPFTGNGGGDLTAVGNWRSGEIALLGSGGAQLGGGVGEQGGISVTGGPVATWGASTVEPLAGGDWQGSISGDVGLGGRLGLSIDGSLSADKDLSPTVDPVSKQYITTVGLTGSYGTGGGADVAITGGAPFMNNTWILLYLDLW